MHRVTSNLTIFFKIFIPTVWIVFFTSILITIFTISSQTLPVLTTTSFKIGYTIFYVIFLLFLYFTVFQLKRVELGPEYYIATNYFRTYKLIYDDIEEITTTSLGRFILVKFKLKAKSSLGRKIYFLASKQLYEIFMNSHPEVEAYLSTLNKNQEV
ncbi:MAG: hypothetical protein LC107_07870 [Chitinophagales bacterium]|nr:hypothetical protein [Chitinophagales bacterium]